MTDAARSAQNDSGCGDLGGAMFEALLNAIAAKRPAPGGGAVAAMLAAISSALATMVVNYSTGRKSLAEHEDLYSKSLDALSTLRSAALRAGTDDAAAYERLNALQKLDPDDPGRVAQWDVAVAGAIDAPRRCGRAAVELLELCAALCGRSNAWLASDLAIAAIAAEAAAASAAWNVRVNLPLVADASRRAALEREVAAEIHRCRELRAAVESRCHAGK